VNDILGVAGAAAITTLRAGTTSGIVDRREAS